MIIRRRFATIVLGSVGVLTGAAGCSSSGGAADSDWGVVRVALNEVPMDTRCLSISATGTRSVTQRFSVVPGQSAALEMAGLPLGEVQFTGVAFDEACQAMMSTEPTWIGGPVTATVVKGEVANVVLTMRRNGRASVSVDFCDIDVSSDVANCGDCGRACPLPPYSRATCVAGACGFACDAPRTDCDGDAANGCEADLASDAAHCGSCETACAPGRACRLGVCADQMPVAVGAGSWHSCAIVRGSVKCWGDNSAGQLGNASFDNSLAPVEVQGLSADVSAFGIGALHSCAVIGGGVRCWGKNESGQIGDGSLVNARSPVSVTGLSSGATAVCAGGRHSCAVVNGGVQCWGANNAGQLGDGTHVSASTPVVVHGLTAGVTAISCGGVWSTLGSFTCALVNGGVQCWGSNLNGRLGDGTTVERQIPVQVQGLTSGVTDIAAGSTHSCAVVNGGVQCWGQSVLSDPGTLIPAPVVGLGTGATAVSGGRFMTCAVVAHAAKCWGSNTTFQLGDGTSQDSSEPVQVLGLTTGVAAISAGVSEENAGHACAVVNGAVQCWGFGGNGELGNGSFASGGPYVVMGL